MARQFETLNQLSENLRADPRTVSRELNNAGITPDGEIARGKRTMPIYDRERIQKAMAADLLKMFQKS